MSLGNHGPRCNDIIIGSLAIKGQTVIDSNKNLCVKSGKIRQDLFVGGKIVQKESIQIETADLPLTITEPGNYSLKENMDYAPTDPNVPAIHITTSGVCLNLNKFCLRQTNAVDPCTLIIIDPFLTDITILNGTVKDATKSGIEFKGANTRVTLLHLTVTGCGYGVPLYPGYNGGLILGYTLEDETSGRVTTFHGIMDTIAMDDVHTDNNIRIGTYLGSGQKWDFCNCSSNHNNSGQLPGEDDFLVAYGYFCRDDPPFIDASNLTTAIGSTTVTVVETAHLRNTGDLVIIDGRIGSAVDTTLNGIPTSEIWHLKKSITVLDPNTFTFEVTSPATSTGAANDEFIVYPTKHFGLKYLRMINCSADCNESVMDVDVPVVELMDCVGFALFTGVFDNESLEFYNCSFSSNRTSYGTNPVIPAPFTNCVGINFSANRVIMENCRVNGNSSRNECNGIAGTHVSGKFKNCSFSNNQGLSDRIFRSTSIPRGRGYVTDSADNLTFEDCCFDNNTGIVVRGSLSGGFPQGYGFENFGNHKNVSFKKCRFTGNYTNTNSFGGGSHGILFSAFNGSDSYVGDNILIQDCYFARNYDPETVVLTQSIAGGLHADILALDTNFSNGFLPSGNFKNLCIDNCVFNGHGAWGIFTLGRKNTIIKDCKITNAQIGIQLGGAVFGFFNVDETDSQIINNDISNCSGEAVKEIHSGNSTSLVVKNHAFNCGSTFNSGFDVTNGAGPVPVLTGNISAGGIPVLTDGFTNTHITN